MKVTLRDIWVATQTFNKVFSYSSFEGKTAYAMARRSRVITQQSEDIDKARLAFIREFAQMDDKGEMVTIDNQVQFTSKSGFEDKFNAFLADEVELDLWPIKYPEIEGMTDVVETVDEKAKTRTASHYLTPFEIGLLIPFMTELPD